MHTHILKEPIHVTLPPPNKLDAFPNCKVKQLHFRRLQSCAHSLQRREPDKTPDHKISSVYICPEQAMTKAFSNCAGTASEYGFVFISSKS